LNLSKLARGRTAQFSLLCTVQVV